MKPLELFLHLCDYINATEAVKEGKPQESVADEEYSILLSEVRKYEKTARQRKAKQKLLDALGAEPE